MTDETQITPRESNNNTNNTSNNRNNRPSGRNIILTTILGAVLLGILIVGYLIVDTLLTLQRGALAVPNAVATQVDSVINPTPTLYADPQTVILQVQSLSRLETSSYTIEKVITAESNDGPMGFLFRDRLLLVAQGDVIAGVDLSRVGEEDIQVVGGSVFITLPAAEIFVATLNNDETYVYDRETAILGDNIDLETLARQEAERVILEAALEDGILSKAQQNAETTITGLMYALGFEEVIFVVGTPAPDQYRGED